MNTNIHTTRNPIRVALAALTLAAAFAGAARAADAPQIHVKYADLDVNTVAGATVLYRRIHTAATHVCAVPGAGDLGLLARIDACTDRAVAEAVAAVDNATLTGLYMAKTGGNPAMRLATTH